MFERIVVTAGWVLNVIISCMKDKGLVPSTLKVAALPSASPAAGVAVLVFPVNAEPSFT
jgi:hypothetical protein